MYRIIQYVFQWAVIFIVNLPRLKFFYSDKVTQLKNSSHLVITIKYFHADRIFILSILKKKYVPQNTGPLNCGYLQQNNWKYTEICYVESWLNHASSFRVSQT